MLVQFNTDKNIEGTEALALESEATIRQALTRVSAHVTRIEVHVSDENSGQKSGTTDMRCLLEARLSGREPIAVSHSAPTVAQSVDGAADKLKRAIQGVVGRAESSARKQRASAPRADEAPALSSDDVAPSALPIAHADGSTRRPESPTLEGRVPLPEEITGRASGTDESLVELFDNESDAHLADGFRGGSDDEALDDEEAIGAKVRPSTDADRAERERR
jgi:ribosome-associated translation inhibitor RaiA